MQGYVSGWTTFAVEKEHQKSGLNKRSSCQGQPHRLSKAALTISLKHHYKAINHGGLTKKNMQYDHIHQNMSIFILSQKREIKFGLLYTYNIKENLTNINSVKQFTDMILRREHIQI